MDEKLVLPKDFDEYIRDVIEISTQSNKDNSIHYGFEMRKDFITNRISLVDNKSGKMELLKEVMSHFLSPFLYQFIDNNVIVSHNVVDLNNDNLLTYRFLTDTNDLLSINGLTFEDTSYISDLVEDLDMNHSDEGKIFTLSKNGKASGWVILFLVIAICLILFIVSQFL